MTTRVKIEKLHSDILIVAEAEKMNNSRSVCWFDSKAQGKGLAVLALWRLFHRTTSDVSRASQNDCASNHKRTNLIPAICGCGTIGRTGAYVIPLMEAFEEYKGLMATQKVNLGRRFQCQASVLTKNIDRRNCGAFRISWDAMQEICGG